VTNNLCVCAWWFREGIEKPYVDWNLSNHFGTVHYRTRSHFPCWFWVISIALLNGVFQEDCGHNNAFGWLLYTCHAKFLQSQAPILIHKLYAPNFQPLYAQEAPPIMWKLYDNSYKAAIISWALDIQYVPIPANWILKISELACSQSRCSLYCESNHCYSIRVPSSFDLPVFGISLYQWIELHALQVV